MSTTGVRRAAEAGGETFAAHGVRHAFGVPVWLHADDREHVMRPDPCLRFWEGDAQPLLPEVVLHRLGGHFAGGKLPEPLAGNLRELFRGRHACEQVVDALLERSGRLAVEGQRRARGLSGEERRESE